MARAVLIPFAKESAMRFSVLAADVLRHLEKVKGYSPNTIEAYDRTYRQFAAYVRDQVRQQDDVRHFTGPNVLGFVDYIAGRGVQPNTILRALAALRTLAKQAGYMELHGKPIVAVDPTRAFEWPAATTPTTHYLHKDELRAVLDEDVKPYMAMARDFLLETGLRASEVARATVGDFRQTDGKYFVAVTVKGRGVRSRAIEVPVSRTLGDRLRDGILARGTANTPTAPLLVGGFGQPLTRSALSCMMARLGKAAGVTRLRLSSHKFRHTTNVMRRIAGIDPHTRSRMLGQSSTRSLERYEHLVPGELHEATERQLDAMQRYIAEDIPRDIT